MLINMINSNKCNNNFNNSIKILILCNLVLIRSITSNSYTTNSCSKHKKIPKINTIYNNNSNTNSNNNNFNKYNNSNSYQKFLYKAPNKITRTL